MKFAFSASGAALSTASSRFWLSEAPARKLFQCLSQLFLKFRSEHCGITRGEGADSCAEARELGCKPDSQQMKEMRWGAD